MQTHQEQLEAAIANVKQAQAQLKVRVDQLEKLLLEVAKAS